VYNQTRVSQHRWWTRADALAKGLERAAGAVSVQQITVHTYPATAKVFCGS
jgi:hypothetical protein